MANSFQFKNKIFKVGDTISLSYKIKEGEKEKTQIFKGILIKIKGDKPAEKTITIRKISRSGIGVEKIIPLMSPFINNISLIKKGRVRRSKLYFIRSLSDQQLLQKLYRKR